jgi:hypothetical protein
MGWLCMFVSFCEPYVIFVGFLTTRLCQHLFLFVFDTIVSILFLFDYLLCDCPKFYLFINDTQQDVYYKGYDKHDWIVNTRNLWKIYVHKFICIYKYFILSVIICYRFDDRVSIL